MVKDTLQGKGQTVMEVAVRKGRGWEPGQLQAKLGALVDAYAHVPKQPPFVYDGGPIGELPFPCTPASTIRLTL